MTVKIVIRRNVPKNKEKELLPLIKELRIATTRQPGYISGETLQRIDKPGETVVVSTWEEVEDWNRWVTSALSCRKKLTLCWGMKRNMKFTAIPVNSGAGEFFSIPTVNKSIRSLSVFLHMMLSAW
jgi:quinol monooxygenase YgiN